MKARLARAFFISETKAVLGVHAYAFGVHAYANHSDGCHITTCKNYILWRALRGNLDSRALL